LGGGAPLILIVSNALDATTDFFEERLRARGRAFLRLDTESLGSADLTFYAGCKPTTRRAKFKGVALDADDIHAIYYRRPRPPAVGGNRMSVGEREWVDSELRRAWGGWLAATNARWVNHPLAISSASYKPEQLARAEQLGIDIPETLITTDPDEARAFARDCGMEMVVKPIGHGQVEGPGDEVSRLIYTTALGPSDSRLLNQVALCPTLLQRRVPKEVDLRVTIVGVSVLAVALHSQEQQVSAIDCRRDNMRGMRYSAVSLPPQLAERLVAYVKSYGLVYAAIDLILDPNGRYWFLEINPAGQWAWLEQQIAIPISDALVDALDER
jgi:hypothetical protein